MLPDTNERLLISKPLTTMALRQGTIEARASNRRDYHWPTSGTQKFSGESIHGFLFRPEYNAFKHETRK